MGQHPTVRMKNRFNNVNKFGRVLYPYNTNNMHTIKIKHCLMRLNREGVVVGQHPTVRMKNRFNNVNKFGRVLYPYNTNTMHMIKIKHCLVHLNKEGVVVGQALKCSASEALNAESYNNPTVLV